MPLHIVTRGDDITDFGFEVDHKSRNRITLDTSTITYTNEWNDDFDEWMHDFDEWMHFIFYEFDFFDDAQGKEQKRASSNRPSQNHHNGTTSSET